ncbi:MAG: L-serine ammonia-lyase, iron-sulfur-dependent, subunit alpha [Planctomycetota bacterium]
MTVSIFNDVIGPIMRGPSSSHCAAALRIGRLARDLAHRRFDEVLVEFDNAGSLPTTHQSQGSDMGLFGGLLGWEADDERLPDSKKHLADAGIKIEFVYGDYGDAHPNTYRLTLKNDQTNCSLIAISTGGGMIEVIELEGMPVKLDGGFDETLVYLTIDRQANEPTTMEPIRQQFLAIDSVAAANYYEPQNILHVQSTRAISDESIFDLLDNDSVANIVRLQPVLPVRSQLPVTGSRPVPFLTCREMEQYQESKELSLSELAIEFESARGAMSKTDVVNQMVRIVNILRKSLSEGLAGTEYDDRVLGFQSGKFAEQMQQSKLIDAGIVNRIVLYTTALMEIKSSMGVIVAAPTAGACAALPATCIAIGDVNGLSDEEIAEGMLAAGMIGVFIAHAWSFAAEVGGCQAEGGSASAMAAAAAVTYSGGSQKQATAAASMALQNMLGLICDPVANRVEAPCLGKNVMAASNAICCANMAMSGFDALIPLDETIDAAKRVSAMMPREHRCTGLGGLSTTPTSLKIMEQLACGQHKCGSC